MYPIRVDPRYRLYGMFDIYREIARSSFPVGQPRVSADPLLESRVKDFCNAEHVLPVPQNRVGIYLVIRHLLANSGDRKDVIMSPYTIADVANMVILAGGRPVFTDIDPETCNIAAEGVRMNITRSTGAIIVTHLHGVTAEIEQICAIGREHNIPVVEDCAQVLGACVSGKRVGTFGCVGIFSFGLYKNVNTLMGGAVVTNDAALFGAAKKELDGYPCQPLGPLLKKLVKGITLQVSTSTPLFQTLVFPVFRHAFLNDIEVINRFAKTELNVRRKDTIPREYLARMRPFQVRSAIAQLENVDQYNDQRIERARIYHEHLFGVDGLTLPPFNGDGSQIYTYYPIQVDHREDLLRYLMKCDIDVGSQHYHNLSLLEGFNKFTGDCPNTTSVVGKLVLLPTYPGYPISSVYKIAETITEYLKAGG